MVSNKQLIIGLGVVAAVAYFIFNKSSEASAPSANQSSNQSPGGSGAASGGSISQAYGDFPSISPGGSSVLNPSSSGVDPNTSSYGTPRGTGSTYSTTLAGGSLPFEVSLKPTQIQNLTTRQYSGSEQRTLTALANTYGTETQVLPNYMGNPQNYLVQLVGGEVKNVSRSPQNPTEVIQSRAQNVADLYSRGLMTEEQVKNAGFNPQQLSAAYSAVRAEQAPAEAQLRQTSGSYITTTSYEAAVRSSQLNPGREIRFPGGSIVNGVATTPSTNQTTTGNVSANAVTEPVARTFEQRQLDTSSRMSSSTVGSGSTRNLSPSNVSSVAPSRTLAPSNVSSVSSSSGVIRASPSSSAVTSVSQLSAAQRASRL